MKRIAFAFAIFISLQGCLYEKNDTSPSGTNNGGTTDTTTSNITCGSGTNTNPSSEVCFNTQILPFFQANCSQSGCHDAKTHAEGYNLTTYAGIKKGISTSNPTNSKLYRVIVDTGRERMPPPPSASITKTQSDLILKWVKEGAKETNCAVYINAENATYAAVIKPFIDVNCLGCHQAGNASGNVLLNSYANIKVLADNGRLLGSIKSSPGFVAMPPSRKLSTCEISAFQNWITKGAKND